MKPQIKWSWCSRAALAGRAERLPRAEPRAIIGGSPSHVQRVLIERAARLMLYIEIMDRETLEAGTMSERNSRQYLAWT